MTSRICIILELRRLDKTIRPLQTYYSACKLPTFNIHNSRELPVEGDAQAIRTSTATYVLSLFPFDPPFSLSATPQFPKRVINT